MSVSTVFFVRHSTSNVKVLPFAPRRSGPYECISCTSSTTTPSGASGLQAHLCLCPPLRLRGRTGVFPPPRGSSSPAPLGHPLLPPLAVRAFSLTRRFLMPRSAACGSTLSGGSAFPSSGPTTSFLSSSMRVQFLFGGGRTCFPDRDCRRLPRIALHISSLLLACSAEPFSTGAAGRVFPGRDCVRLSSPLLHSSTLLISTRSSCASMAWGSTVFGVAALVIHFEDRKVGQWVLAHWFSGIHSLEPTKTGQATPGVSVARLFHGLFSSSLQGEERARIPAEFRACIFKPLGSSGALREGLKTTSGGRLACSAGV